LDPSPIQFCFYIKIRSYKLLPLDVAMLPHGNNEIIIGEDDVLLVPA
jgi:hypothetical protein